MDKPHIRLLYKPINQLKLTNMYILRNNKLTNIDISEDKMGEIKITKPNSMFDNYTLKCEISRKTDSEVYIFRADKDARYGATGEHQTIGEAIRSALSRDFRAYKNDEEITL